MTYRLLITTLLLTALAAGASAALFDGQTIGQKGRNFSTLLVHVRRGERLIFINDDTVPHNVMSLTRNNSFDLGSQMPGTAVPVTFDEAGLVDVICAIHPRMRMSVEVSD